MIQEVEFNTGEDLKDLEKSNVTLAFLKIGRMTCLLLASLS